AATLLLENRLDEADQAAAKAVDLDSENARANVALGNVRLAQKRYDEAIVEYQKALDRFPSLLVAREQLALARSAKARSAAEQARTGLDAVVAGIERKEVRTLMETASRTLDEIARVPADRRTPLLDASEAAAREAVARDRKNPRAWILLGRVHQAQARHVDSR